MFISTLVQTLFKVVVLAAAAFGGIMAGKILRDKKSSKAKDEA